MNKVVLVGRLSKDPELRTTSNTGTAVCSFTLAVNKRFKRENEPDAVFVNIVVWKGQAESCAKYLRKGSQAAVSGRLDIRSYDDQNGNRKYITEVIADEVQFLSSKSDTPTKSSTKPVYDAPQEIEDSSDLPF